MIAAVEPIDGFLRAGCLLTLDPDPANPAEWKLVRRDGKHDLVALDRDIVINYAQSSADRFGRGPDRQVIFNAELAKEDVRKADKKRAGRGKATDARAGGNVEAA